MTERSPVKRLHCVCVCYFNCPARTSHWGSQYQPSSPQCMCACNNSSTRVRKETNYTRIYSPASVAYTRSCAISLHSSELRPLSRVSHKFRLLRTGNVRARVCVCAPHNKRACGACMFMYGAVRMCADGCHLHLGYAWRCCAACKIDEFYLLRRVQMETTYILGTTVIHQCICKIHIHNDHQMGHNILSKHTVNIPFCCFELNTFWLDRAHN